jgi:hypothetical protein
VEIVSELKISEVINTFSPKRVESFAKKNLIFSIAKRNKFSPKEFAKKSFSLFKTVFRYFDDSVLRFLQKFQCNSLLTKGNLHFFECHADDPQLVNFLTNVVPLLTNIQSTDISDETHLLDHFQNEYSVLAMPMLTSTRVLHAKLAVFPFSI